MTLPGGDEADPQRAHDAAVRRRRRERFFGEVLPEQTGDERGDADEGAGAGSEEWLRSQVPPHHG